MFATAPRSLGDPGRVAERTALLATAEATRPLVEWAGALVARRGVHVPSFDPAEAGVNARVMLVLEAPGPMTTVEGGRPGSGFISVDNDDVTAENVWRAREEVGLHDGFLAWNIVPWYLDPASTKPSAKELEEGAGELRSLLRLLPDLQAVILGGKHAQRGWARHIQPFVRDKYVTIESWHPSPLALNRPERREQFVATFRRAAAFA